MNQFSEHDPMQNDAAMIRGLGSLYPRGRWQRRVAIVGSVALAVLAVVLIAGLVLRR